MFLYTMIILIMMFVTIGFMSGGRLLQTPAITESHIPDYDKIARMERPIWGSSFHSAGWGASDHGYCKCNIVCYPTTYYLPSINTHIPPKPWEDRYGE